MKKINEEELMQGSILEMLKKAKINPMKKDPRLVGEVISIIIGDDKMKYAFTKACADRNRSPKDIANKAIRFWLKENGYL
jgi:hypothetical protein